MIIYQCTPTRRIVQHNDEHYDIETLFTINPQQGVVEEVWAVIECGITGEDEMTPRRPIELVQASQDCAEAWLKRDAMIDAGDTVGVKAMDLTCDILDERYHKIYREWQILGGTSNIESIALPLPAEHYEEVAGSEWKAEMTARHADWKDEQETNLDAQGRRYDFTPTPKDMPNVSLDDVEEIQF